MAPNGSYCCSDDILDRNDSLVDYYYHPSVLESTIILTVLGLVLFVGIVGNLLVLIIIAAVKSMHTVVNRCLFSLALADLVILVTLPIGPLVTEFAYDRIPLGLQFCQFLNTYDRGASLCSVVLFCYVTVDRYFAICHPFKSRRFLGGSKIDVILVIIWVISLGLSYPYIHQTVYEQYVDNHTGVTLYRCYFSFAEDWFVWYDTFFGNLFFYLAIPVFVVLYGRMIKDMRVKVNKNVLNNEPHGSVSRDRSRQKGVIMLLSIVVIFIISQVPFRTLALVGHYNYNLLPQDTGKLFVIVWICRIPIYINSASNPVLYFALSTKFREGFLSVFCHCRRNVESGPMTRDNKLSTLTSKNQCEYTASSELTST